MNNNSNNNSNDNSSKASEIEQKLNAFRVEELESRFEMISIGNSTCSSSCGTEAK